MFNYLINALEIKAISQDQSISTTGADGTNWVDISYAEGPIVLLLSDAGGTAAMTVTVQHSADQSTVATVPAASLVDASTGLATTIAAISTTAVFKAYGLNRELLRRYVRVTYSGTGLTHTVTALLLFQKKIA